MGLMKPDIYTKAVLTVIAIMLTVIACNSYVSPSTKAQAQGQSAGVQLSGTDNGFYLFDNRKGDVWFYSIAGGFTRHYRVPTPGQPPTGGQPVNWPN
jgi:hypothetical protein